MRKLLLLGLLINFVGLINPTISFAQTPPVIAAQPCDTRYWNQMSARAWMQAEREIMQNQNLIFKADSVLEYTCFDQFVSINAHVAGPLFVHTNYFGAPIIPIGAQQSMPRALNAVVSTALGQYRGTAGLTNFGHNYLGGRSVAMSAPNTNSSFVPATTNAAYTCREMADIWRVAKCANFIDNSNFQDTDGFYPFDDLAAGPTGGPNIGGYTSDPEKRQWPPGAQWACTGGLGPGGPWANAIDVATNASNQYAFQAPLGAIYTDVGDRLRPGNCTGGAPGAPSGAIPTGVTVFLQGGAATGSHLDGVCTNPGCSYLRGTTTTVGTCVP